LIVWVGNSPFVLMCAW